MQSTIRKMHLAALLAVLLSFTAQPCLTQERAASLTGTVSDSSGAVVPGARIACTNRNTSEQISATSNETGRFSLHDILPGEYDCVISVAGFAEVRVNGVVVSAFQEATVNVEMSVGGGGGDGKGRLPSPPPPPPPPPSPSPSPSPPPLAESVFTMTDPVWNVWAERSSVPTFEPKNIQAGKDYWVVVNLAALSYRKDEGERVYAQDSSADFVKWVVNNTDIDAADVEVLIVPDRRYFAVQGPSFKSLHIDLRKIRNVQKSGFSLDGSPFAYLQAHGGDAPFSFGIQSFHLKGLSNAPMGNAPVALSIWADGRPVDEVSVNLCVAAKPEDACPSSSAGTGYSLRGVDLSGKGKLPDGALQLIERGSDVVGVFRCNSCANPAYFSWTIGQQSDGWLADRVNEQVQHLTPPVPSQDYFSQTGDTLYNLIFPNSQDPDEAAAEKAFRQFFTAAHAKAATEPPVSLFVRLLSSKPDLVLFPIALMRVPLHDGSKAFLGFSVNVEAPLELQDYSVPAKCISNWVLFVPPSSSDQSLGDLVDARAYASNWIDSITRSCPTCVYSDPGKFSDWLLENGQSAASTSSEALIVLSQYKSNSFFFDESADAPPAVFSSSIRRSFTTPSLAVLDACGTAAPGGSDFMRMLNAHGVSSIISTSTAIPGPMGGQFLKLFADALTKSANDPNYTVSRARFEAVKALSNTPASDGKPYGAQALVFSLVGNGGLRLCMPQQ